ncbi:MAG TPA: flagellar hook-basal body complex protein FliE [Bacillota bacterium]
MTPVDNNRLTGVGSWPGRTTPAANPPAPAEVAESFGQALMRALDGVDAVQQRADQAAEAFALGENHDVAQLMIAAEQARLAMELTVQIRNKVLEAYQEIIRMQV